MILQTLHTTQYHIRYLSLRPARWLSCCWQPRDYRIWLSAPCLAEPHCTGQPHCAAAPLARAVHVMSVHWDMLSRCSPRLVHLAYVAYACMMAPTSTSGVSWSWLTSSFLKLTTTTVDLHTGLFSLEKDIPLSSNSISKTPHGPTLISAHQPTKGFHSNRAIDGGRLQRAGAARPQDGIRGVRRQRGGPDRRQRAAQGP